jgi:hypothetical protein
MNDQKKKKGIGGSVNTTSTYNILSGQIFLAVLARKKTRSGACRRN